MLTTRSKVRIARSTSSLIRSGRAAFGAGDSVIVRRLGVQWHLDLKEGIDLAVYLSCYERSTLKRYRGLVDAGATTFDIGANIGVHTLHLFNARQTKKLFDHEIAFQHVQDLGFDLRFLALARDLLLPELDGLQNHFLVPDQIVHGDAERIGKRNENARARHRLVALVLADRLRRHAVSNFVL